MLVHRAMLMMICKTCKTSKPETAFSVQRSKRSGRFAECKVCQRARNQNWIDSNRERFQHLNRAATSSMRQRDPVRAMLTLAKARCLKRGMEFSLTEADVVIPEFCPVLGIPLSCGLGRGDGHGLAIRDTRASLDRIDNAKGYVPGNVIVVSYRANRIKSDANVSELLKVAKFYARLGTEKAGKATLPKMQQHEEEQEGPMP